VDLSSQIEENPPMSRPLSRLLYHTMIALGKPIGGIRPRRIYDALGRRAYPQAEFEWTQDRWGFELRLSHHYHIDRNILIYGDYDHELHLLLERRIKPGMTALDVGSNLGEMALHMGRLVGATGHVHAFEPMPGAFGRLSEHVARNRLENVVRAWPLALGNHEGMLHLHAPREEADNQGLGSIVNPEIAGASERIEVAASTLDAWRHHESTGKIDFIKLDIQGAEWLFFEGAAETLRTCRPEIAMEISPSDLSKIGHTSRDLVLAVEKLGYRVFEIARGEAARHVRAADLPENYAATNVLCVP
jgi:FkbM family methyltransferase